MSCSFAAQRDAAGLVRGKIPNDLWHFADGMLWGLCAMGLMGMRKFMPAAEFASNWLVKKLPAHAASPLPCCPLPARLRSSAL